MKDLLLLLLLEWRDGAFGARRKRLALMWQLLLLRLIALLGRRVGGH